MFRMFRIIDKNCNASLNIDTGMSKYCRPRSDCSGTAVFPILPLFYGNLAGSQMSESQICLFIFSIATATKMASVNISKLSW